MALIQFGVWFVGGGGDGRSVTVTQEDYDTCGDPKDPPSGCSRSAAILRNPHTCLRRRAKFEGVSVWGLSVRQQRSTELRDGITTRRRGVPKGILRWERWLEAHKGTMAEEGMMALEGMIALMGTMARGGAMALGGIIAPGGTMAPGSSVTLSSRAWPEEATPKRPDEGAVYRQRPFERECREESMDLPSPDGWYLRDTMEE